MSTKNLPVKTIIERRVPIPGEEVKVAVLEEQMKNMVKSVDVLASKIDTLTTKVDDNYVKKEDFNPVKAEVDKLKLQYAKMAGIAVACAAIVDLVIRIIFKS